MGARQDADEIAELAAQYMLFPQPLGLEKIAGQISRAQIDGNWDDLLKWHRVRLRMTRLYEQRRVAERLDMAVRSGG